MTKDDIKQLLVRTKLVDPMAKQWKAMREFAETVDVINAESAKISRMLGVLTELEAEEKALIATIKEKRETFDEEQRAKQEGLKQSLEAYRDGQMKEIESAIKTGNEQLTLFRQSIAKEKKTADELRERNVTVRREAHAAHEALAGNLKAAREKHESALKDLQRERDEAQVLANQHKATLQAEVAELETTIEKLKDYIKRIGNKVLDDE